MSLEREPTYSPRNLFLPFLIPNSPVFSVIVLELGFGNKLMIAVHTCGNVIHDITSILSVILTFRVRTA